MDETTFNTTLESTLSKMKAKNATQAEMQIVARSMLSDYQRQKSTQMTSMVEEPKTNWVKTIGGALISSEKKLGTHLGNVLAAPNVVSDLSSTVDRYTQQTTAMMDAIDKAQASGNMTEAQRLNQIFKEYTKTNKPEMSKFVTPEMQQELEKTFWQTAGEVGGVALDVALAGSYGKAALGAKTGKLLTATERAAQVAQATNVASKAGIVAKGIETGGKVAGTVAPITETFARNGLGPILKSIAKKTLGRIGVGTGIGYGYDVTGNLQEGKTGMEALQPGWGTALGGLTPLAIGAIESGAAITKSVAPRLINSLVKPKAADFAYGKNPGKTVSEMGIVGNSIDDFSKNIDTARQNVGQELGNIYTNPVNSKKIVNVKTELSKLDDAIAQAAKGGKNNQGVVTQLQNIKDALLYEHGVTAEGAIEKIGNALDSTKLNPQQAFELKQRISAATQFTGRPSDDKMVNSILKRLYSDVTNKLNSVVGVNNPEIYKLNEQYGGLTSALIATRNRSAILQKSDLISMPVKIGTVTGIISQLSGAGGVEAVLAGATVAALDKALESTAVRTRVASWIGSQSPSVISNIVNKNPAIRPLILRLVPKMASQI